MPIYNVSWTEELWYTARIEADSESHAQEIVFDGSFVWPEPYASEVQDSIYVEEANAEVQNLV